jgi:hypothetical protein
MYARYLTVENGTGEIIGRAEAIGTLELFEPVFRDEVCINVIINSILPEPSLVCIVYIA